jgi:hypothetical protein
VTSSRRLSADQVDRLRVRAEEPHVAAFLPPPGEHGEAQRGRAGDSNLVALADNLDGYVALAVDVCALLARIGLLHPPASNCFIKTDGDLITTRS